MYNDIDTNFLKLLDGNPTQLLSHKKAFHAAHRHDFVQFLNDYLSTKGGMTKNFLCTQADISTQSYLNGNRHIPVKNRNMVLRLCIAARMDLSETQEALRCCKMSLLDDGIYRDKIIIAGIYAKRPLDDIDMWLYKAEEDSIYDRCTKSV